MKPCANCLKNEARYHRSYQGAWLEATFCGVCDILVNGGEGKLVRAIIDENPVKHIDQVLREMRQTKVQAWCRQAFGDAHANSWKQRGLRFLEEAVELYQVTGGDTEMAHKLIDFVFSRPKGQFEQELGGVGVTLLALAAAAGLSAEAAEVKEVERVTSLPPEHFAARNKAKSEAGFDYITRERRPIDGFSIRDGRYHHVYFHDDPVPQKGIVVKSLCGRLFQTDAVLSERSAAGPDAAWCPECEEVP